MNRLNITFCIIMAGVLFHSCKKEYSLEGGGLKVPSGTWSFKDNLKSFVGNMDTAYIVSLPGTGTKELDLIGTSGDGSQTFHLQLFADAFTTGTYKASLFQSAFKYTMPAKTLYQADQLTGEFIVTITSFTNNIISGTFSGASLDSANKIINLSQGKFTSTIAGNGTGASTGVLGDSSGNCKPVTLAGVYLQGIALTSANTVQAQVIVATAGTYAITTNTVNGITFSKTGTFTSTGTQTVLLNGTGTPTNSGNQNFTISYGNSQCAFKVNFGLPASGTLGGGGADCTPVTLAGVYTQNIALTAANTVQIQVNVTTPGDYSISTNTINGVSFIKSGTFTVTGVQNVILTGTGVPLNPGMHTFAVTFGTGVCNFSITFQPNAVTSNDYFPLSLSSSWNYNNGTSTDLVFVTTVIDHSPAFGGNTYKTLGVYDPSGGPAVDSLYYRKPGGDYYQYVDYSDVLSFDAPVAGEFIFLKDNVAAGATWSSPTVSGTVLGSPVSAYITMTVLEKSVPVTIGTINFPDVIKVRYEYFVTGISLPLETDERWFAKNVGEIHDSYSISGTTTGTYDVGDYLVL
ncbi:MAG: hypothetical protein ABI416_03380 [Ginsengibacter sp.]